MNTVNILTMFIRGVDVAHDESGGALVVSGVNYILGQCVAPDGTAGAAFAIKSNASSGHPYGSFPRARFNPSLQNYLVVWPEEQDGGSMLLKARTISCPSGAMGTTQQIGANPWGESGAAVDWSPLSNKYLVAWKSIAPPNPVVVQLVNADGTQSGSPVTISSGFGRDPGVVWNPITNEFGVSFSGETDTGAFSVFVVVPPGSPASFRRTTFNVISGGKTYLTDMAYNVNTQHYVMSWFQLSNGSFAKIAEFDNSGALLDFGTASTSMGSYDALSLAFNRNSHTFLLAGIDGSDQLRVAELNSRGVRFAPELTASTGFNPVRYPRVDGSAADTHWFTVMSRGNGSAAFQGTGVVVFGTGTTGGGPAGSYDTGGGTTSGGGTSSGCTTVQPGSDWTCVNGSWLPPTTGSTGGTSTGGCTTVQPATGWTCVNGNWIPPTTGSTGGTTTGSCTTVQPGTGWTCVNGNWLPPGSTTTTGSTGSCTTVQPGTGWTCVNGNWLPPGSTTTTGSTGSCTTVQPGTGWTCVNGNWLPPGSTTTSGSTSSCTTVQPGTGWTCVNGNWLPPDSTTVSLTSSTTSTNDGTCTGSAPAAGWVCKQGNWLPPDSPLLTGGGH